MEDRDYVGSQTVGVSEGSGVCTWNSLVQDTGYWRAAVSTVINTGVLFLKNYKPVSRSAISICTGCSNVKHVLNFPRTT